MSDPDITVVDNSEEHRYEARDGQGSVVGFAAYQRGHDTVVFTHTEVDDAQEGKGVGSMLVRGALDDVRGHGLKVLPVCPFVKEYIERHDEYADLVERRRSTARD
jgi:predicted GNAT family acetyltransferase